VKYLFQMLVLSVSASSAIAAASKLMPISAEQQSVIQSQFEVKTKDKKLAEAVGQAKENIGKFLEIESCIANFSGAQLNLYAAPGKQFNDLNYWPVMASARKHVRDTCVTITKIQGWKLSAKNSLEFEVIYTADDSGEIVKKRYDVQKQGDDSWLFI
jgi:hypothetical protein